MRNFHRLRTSVKVSFPHNLIFVDTETTTIDDIEEQHEPVLRLGCAQFVSLDSAGLEIDFKQIVFKHVDQFWGFVESMKQGGIDLYIYAHNWSFDFPVLDGFSWMRELGYKISAIVDASPPVIIRYTKTHNKIVFIDTLNYFRQSLKSLGKSIGLSKIEIDLVNAPTDDLEKYCINDTSIVRLAIINLIGFLIENDLCRLTNTVSSLAMSAFVRRFLDYEILIDGNEKRVALARKSYFGGRTECFKIGKFVGKYYLIDVNSQYPFVMRNNDYPIKAFAHHKRVSIKDVESLLDRYCFTAKCRVSTNIPVFPYKIGGRTCFPLGTFTTHLSTPEFEYGLNNDLIVSVDSVVIYEKARIFENYVDYFYQKRIAYRKAGNEAYQDFCKKMLNTLYGKFGQAGERWEESDIEPRGYPGKWFVYDHPTASRIQYMEIEDQVFYSDKKEESQDSFPAIAAHVTAYGRIMIQLMIDYIGPDHVYYCDTDSLLIDDTAYQRIKSRLDPNVLGCWSLDGEYKDIEIRGAKDYVFGAKEVIKGIRPDHTITNDGLYRQLQFSSLRGSINRGVIDKPLIKHIEKRLNRRYLKACVGGCGVVTPFKLVDGELPDDKSD